MFNSIFNSIKSAISSGYNTVKNVLSSAGKSLVAGAAGALGGQSKAPLTGPNVNYSPAPPQYGPGLSYTPNPYGGNQSLVAAPRVNNSPEAQSPFDYPATRPLLPASTPGFGSSSGYDAASNSNITYDNTTGQIHTAALPGFSGLGGSGSFGGNFAPSPQQGAPGGSPAFTGLLRGAGGQSTPSVINPPSDEEKKKNAQNGVGSSMLPSRIAQYMLNPVGSLATDLGTSGANSLLRFFNPSPNNTQLQSPAVGPTMDAGSLQESANTNRDVLNNDYSQNADDRTQFYNDANTQVANSLSKQPPTPEMPVNETDTQKEFISQFPEREQFDVRKAMDNIRQSLGLPQLEAQRLDTIKQIAATNEAFMKITDDIKLNPDLPKGLALRRIQDAQSTQKERIMQLTDQANIFGQQIQDANSALDREFNIEKLQSDQEQKQIDTDRATLSLMINSGAIGGFNDKDVAAWSLKTGIPANALKSVSEKASQPDVKLQEFNGSVYAVKVAKNGSITSEKILGNTSGQITGPVAYGELTPLAKSVVDGTLKLKDITPTQRAQVGPELNAYGYTQQVATEDKQKLAVIINGIGDVLTKWSAVPDQYKGSIQGRLPFVQENVPSVQAFETARGYVSQQVARLVEQGRLSDDDRKFYEGLIPNRTQGSYNVANSGAQALIDRLNTQLQDQLPKGPVKADQQIQYNGAIYQIGPDGSAKKVSSVSIPQNTLAGQNNNPGNLRFAGQAGATQGAGGFAAFSTPQAGVQALASQIALDASRGLTLEQFISKYAPPSENNTPLYVKQISTALGVAPGAKISTVDLSKLVAAIAQKESGTKLAYE